MRGVSRLLAVALAGNDDAHGRLGVLHHADLVGGGVGAEQDLALALDEGVDPDRVPHVAGGVVVGDADGVEVVARPLDLGPLEDAEPHLREGLDAVVHRLGDRMEASERLRPARQGHVEGGARGEGREGIGAGGLAARFQLAFERRLELVQGLAQGRALVGRSVLEGAQAEGQAAVLAAQPLGAPRLASGLAIRLRQRFQRFRPERVDLRFDRGHG